MSAAGTNGALTVKLDRLCKLTCSPTVLRDGVRIATALASRFSHPERLAEGGERKERREEEEAVCDNEASGKKGKVLARVPFPIVQLSTGQVLLEVVMSDKEEEITSWLERSSSSPEEEQTCSSSASSSKESILVSWEYLTFSSARSSLESGLHVGVTLCPPLGGALCLSGLQLLSSCSGCTEYVVPPTTLYVSVAQHQPNSKLDQ